MLTNQIKMHNFNQIQIITKKSREKAYFHLFKIAIP